MLSTGYAVFITQRIIGQGKQTIYVCGIILIKHIDQCLAEASVFVLVMSNGYPVYNLTSSCCVFFSTAFIGFCSIETTCLQVEATKSLLRITNTYVKTKC